MEEIRYKSRLPPLIMGNVRSWLIMDDITLLARSWTEYLDCSLMCFTKMWLHQDISDDVSIDGFWTQGCPIRRSRSTGRLKIKS